MSLCCMYGTNTMWLKISKLCFKKLFLFLVYPDLNIKLILKRKNLKNNYFLGNTILPTLLLWPFYFKTRYRFFFLLSFSLLFTFILLQSLLYTLYSHFFLSFYFVFLHSLLFCCALDLLPLFAWLADASAFLLSVICTYFYCPFFTDISLLSLFF